ncbi:hypothetical protein ACFL96_16655 [Thermoproteota archaeon]
MEMNQLGASLQVKKTTQQTQKTQKEQAQVDGKQQFEKALHEAARAVLPAEEMEKQRLFRDKLKRERGEGRISDEEEEKTLKKKIEKITKKISDLSKRERQGLGL